MNRVLVVAGGLAAGLIVLTGCSGKDDSAAGKTNSAEEKITTSTAGTTSAPSTTTSVPSSSSVSATPSASKEAFCNDINKAVAIIELPGTQVTPEQNNDLLKALWSASDAAPSDVPAEFREVITALIAVGQGPDSESVEKNGEKLAANAEKYCGAPLP